MTRAYDTYKELVFTQQKMMDELHRMKDIREELHYNITRLEITERNFTDLRGAVIRILENEYGGDWDVGE